MKIKTDRNTKRDSNIELARLILMLFVIILHVNGKGLINLKSIDNNAWLFKNFTESFSVIAVDCFILISGYYSIKFNFGNLISLILQCIFYNILIFICYTFFVTHSFTLISFFSSIVKFGHWWFIIAYIVLYIFSPLLNAAVKYMPKNQLLLVIILLLIIRPNPINFFLLYLIGAYLKQYAGSIIASVNKYKFLSGYVLISLIMTLLLVIVNITNHDNYITLIIGYNSLFVIFSAILFFCFMKTVNIQSPLVNWAASSVFAIYLIHEHYLISPILAGYVNNISYQYANNSLVLYVTLALLVFSIFIFSIIVDKFRLYIMRPINNNINQYDFQSLFMKVTEFLAKRI